MEYNLTISIEQIYHFSCGRCTKWWSIGDYPIERVVSITCPHCKQTYYLNMEKANAKN